MPPAVISLFHFFFSLSAPAFAVPPSGFVDMARIHPGIRIEMRYFGDWIFMGRKVPGYQANRCYLTLRAAEALARAQEQATKMGYSLLVFDCFRPKSAVQAFVEWTRNEQDRKMKSVFYPDEPKSKLIERGYIADRSGHSRGSTVDLTLVREKGAANRGSAPEKNYRESANDCRLQSGIEKTGQLDMGTTFDCFSELAATDHEKTPPTAAANRRLLRRIMEEAGFLNYEKEWWHYTLRNEPHPNHYFDFKVE